MVLDQQPLFPNLLKRPPDALHVLSGHSPVGLVEVDPKSHSAGHSSKGADMALYRFAALLIEGGNSIALDIALTRKAQLFLHCNFHRQTVTVPASFSDDLVTFHRLEARKEIFEDASLNMVGSRHPIGSWRSLEEGPPRGAFAICYRFIKNRILLPK